MPLSDDKLAIVDAGIAGTVDADVLLYRRLNALLGDVFEVVPDSVDSDEDRPLPLLTYRVVVIAAVRDSAPMPHHWRAALDMWITHDDPDEIRKLGWFVYNQVRKMDDPFSGEQVEPAVGVVSQVEDRALFSASELRHVDARGLYEVGAAFNILISNN